MPQPIHHVGPCRICGAAVNERCVQATGAVGLEMHAGRTLHRYLADAPPEDAQPVSAAFEHTEARCGPVAPEVRCACGAYVIKAG